MEEEIEELKQRIEILEKELECAIVDQQRAYNQGFQEGYEEGTKDAQSEYVAYY